MEGDPRKVDSRAFFYTGQTTKTILFAVMLMYTEKTIKTTLIAGLAQVGGKFEGGGVQKQSTAESGSLILE
jgi:hypothetical protein